MNSRRILTLHIRLKNKRPDDYYREIVDDKEQQKRLDEAFGSKTDFSLSNYENNYDKFNQEEKEMFTHKMQGYLNKKGYTGKDGYYLKYDGILGPNTKNALNNYIKDNLNDHKEAVELKENHITDIDYNEEPLMFTNTNETANKIAPVSFKKSITTEEKEEKQSLSDWLEQGSKQTTKNTSAKYITTIITGRLLDAKSKYLDAQKSGNQLEMKIQSEIGKYIKEVLRNVVENSEKVGDKKFRKMFSSSMEYDKNGNNPEISINNWREILKYSDDLAEHEFALVDLINQANGITVKQVDNDITAIRAICNDAYKKGILDNLTFYIGPDIYKGNYTEPYHSYYYTNSDKTTSKLLWTNYPKDFDYTTGQEKESGAGNFLKIFGY